MASPPQAPPRRIHVVTPVPSPADVQPPRPRPRPPLLPSSSLDLEQGSRHVIAPSAMELASPRVAPPVSSSSTSSTSPAARQGRCRPHRPTPSPGLLCFVATTTMAAATINQPRGSPPVSVVPSSLFRLHTPPAHATNSQQLELPPCISGDLPRQGLDESLDAPPDVLMPLFEPCTTTW